MVGRQELEKGSVRPLYNNRLERRVVGLLKNKDGVLLSYCACGDIGDRDSYAWRGVDMRQEEDFFSRRVVGEAIPLGREEEYEETLRNNDAEHEGEMKRKHSGPLADAFFSREESNRHPSPLEEGGGRGPLVEEPVGVGVGSQFEVASMSRRGRRARVA